MRKNTQIAQALLTQLLAAVRRDRANRYSLFTPWTLPRLAENVPDYHGTLIEIAASVVTVRPYNGDVNDGCTLAPDWIGAWRPVVAACFHDPWYEEMDAMAADWKWPVSRVRALGDRIFYGILLQVAPWWIARIYYRAVRAFGGIAHFIMRQAAPLLVVAVLLGLAGCAGCTGPATPWEDPDAPVAMPDYEQTAGGNQ